MRQPSTHGLILGSVWGLFWLAALAQYPAKADQSVWFGDKGDGSENLSESGRKRFFDVDRNKTFDPGLARFGSRSSSSGNRSATTRVFGSSNTFNSGKDSASTKSFPSSAFYSPRFTQSASDVRPFTSKSFLLRAPASESTPGKTVAQSNFSVRDFKPPTGSLAAPAGSASYPTREYDGPEAQKKKIPYTPANGPTGGVSYGRVLSVDEVREILNKSK